MKERLTVSNFAFNLEHDSYTYSSSYTKEEIKKIKDTSEKEIYAKLGKLEDIEEELGIDLVTLFKAFENGVWRKGLDYIEQVNVWLGNCNGSLYLEYSRFREALLFEDYGKTWALTKEELEWKE